MSYPVNLLVAGKAVLVVGGGAVALDKVRGLVEAGADVTVVAPEVHAGIEALGVAVERRRYEPPEAGRYRLVVTATGDLAVAARVHEDAEAAGVWVNAADDPERCTFTLPARVRRGDVLVTVSTGGRSPALARWLRERLDDWLAPELGVLLDLAAEERARARASMTTIDPANWRRAFESGMLERIREGDLVGARELLRTCLSSSSA